jgi:hypothetical protein
MKKWHTAGLLLLVLVGTMVVACGTTKETTTTAAPTTVAPTTTAPPTTAPPTTAPPTTAPPTTVAVAETGIFFEDLGGGKVHIYVVPEPGQKFDVGTEGGFGDKIEAFDAAGKSLGLLDLPDAAAGVLDYSAVAGIAKLIVTDVPHGNVEYTYEVPAADGAAAETGIKFEDLGGGKVHITTVPGPGMLFDVSTEGGFGVKIEAFDAAGKSLGLVECPDAAKGVVDYSALAGIAKLVVTDVPHGNVEYEYLIP